MFLFYIKNRFLNYIRNLLVCIHVNSQFIKLFSELFILVSIFLKDLLYFKPLLFFSLYEKLLSLEFVSKFIKLVFIDLNGFILLRLNLITDLLENEDLSCSVIQFFIDTLEP